MFSLGEPVNRPKSRAGKIPATAKSDTSTPSDSSLCSTFIFFFFFFFFLKNLYSGYNSKRNTGRAV